MPDEVHEVYKRRAAAAGKSLQEYLLWNLTDRRRPAGRGPGLRCSIELLA